jgi:WD repeat-containing protein 19
MINQLFSLNIQLINHCTSLQALEEAIMIPNISKQVIGILFDYSQPSVFVAFDNKVCTTYVFVRYSVQGKFVRKVGETKLLSDQVPLMLYDGDLCLYSAGKLSTIYLSTHKVSPTMDIKDQLKQSIQLQKYQEAFDLCKTIDDEECWKQLGEACIYDLEISFAMKVYRKIGEAAMVESLDDIKNFEEINLLAGHCSILLNKNDEAKQFFAKSSVAVEALDLCRDLLQWEQAMALSTNLAKDQMPVIAREYAQQLELNGNHMEALINYDKAIKHFESDDDEDHFKVAKAGIARCTIRCGNFSNGIQIANELNDKQLFNECAEALEQMNQLSEAAVLYEKSENFDKACGLYIHLKQWSKVDKILPHVTSLKLHGQHAKAKEAEGKYQEAIKSYQMANDLDSVVRIYIEHLSDPHSASEIVLETRSIEGGKMLAKFYQTINDYESALQFLILCGSVNEAFQLAHKYNKLRHYGELLEQYDGAKPNDFLSLAQYFENEKYTLLTGKYYFLAREYSKALKLLMKASVFGNEEHQALSLAIDCVASSNDDRLASNLIEFLLGESDGKPKDPKLLFRLYMARKQFREAAKTSVIISNQEQIAGNYRAAHDLLYSMYQELRRNGLTVGNDMKTSLTLLHRYILVRIHVKRGDHEMAAKLLVEVAKNISQFPSREFNIIFMFFNLIIFSIQIFHFFNYFSTRT